MTRSYSKSISDSVRLTARAERRWGPKHRWHCVYCGRGAGMVVDHFIPSKRGGSDEPFNLMPACDRCNSSKMDHPPLEWMRAVGVPEGRRNLLVAVWNSPSWVAPRDLFITRHLLDYSAAKALKRPQGPKRRPKRAS